MRLLAVILSLLSINAFASDYLFESTRIAKLKEAADRGDVGALKEAADRGDVDALDKIGDYYFLKVIPKDPVEAFKWYQKAANLGLAISQFQVGFCYSNGEGVLKDPVEAYAYYNLAGITFFPARTNRDTLEKKMTPSQIEAAVKRSKELQKEIEKNIAENTAMIKRKRGW